MDDVIRRQDAIELIKNYCENGCDIAEDNWCPSCQREQFIELLKSLPSAQQWIPCSERLPSNEDYDETFTVTIQCEHHNGWDDYVTGYAEWTPHGWDIQSYYIGQIKVVAWMPLPKPYKPESEEA